MKTTANFLDDLRAHFGVPSDNKLALKMGWERQQLSQYRQLKVTFNDRTAMKVAGVLGIEPDYILACMAAQRATPESRSAWERIAAKVAACLVFGIALNLVPTPAPARILHNQNVPTVPASLEGDGNTHMRQRRRQWGAVAWIRGALGLSRLGRTLTLTLALAACSAIPPGATIRAELHELDGPALVALCNHGERESEPDLNGCYRWIGGACHIYTLPRWVREQRDGDLSGYHGTLGHELDHCARGNFHGEDRGVILPRPPRL